MTEPADEVPTVVVRGPSRSRGRTVAAFVAGCLLGAVFLAVIIPWLSEPPPAAAPAGLDPRPRPVPAVDGPLAGLVVYVSAGHGYLLHREHHDGVPIRWGLQRDAWHGIIEDLYTAAFVADQLAPRLEAAGATVIALRERDRNREAVVLEERDAAVAGATRWLADPLASQGYSLEIAPGGYATWTLEVPHEGHWYLYLRWSADDSYDATAIATVSGPGISHETVLDQRSHGGHWMKIADESLPAGTPLEVRVDGAGAAPFTIDALRLGGGTLRVVPEPDFVYREHPAFDVSFAHQWDWLGAPEDVAMYPCTNPRSDMRLRPHWVDWASPDDEDAVYLSIHTNGGRGQGAIVFAGIDSTPPTPPRPGSEALAAAVEAELVGSGRTVDPTYASKGWLWGDYSEVSPVHNPLPAILVELAFHDHPADAARLRNPRMQAAMASGIVEGVVRWRTRPESIELP